MLNCYPLGFYSPATLVKDAQRHGVEMRPIDLAHSDWNCTLERADTHAPDPAAAPSPASLRPASSSAKERARTSPLAVRMGLRYVAGVRREVGERIERERARRPFSSIADFTARASPNRRELDALAYAGVFASFGMTRRDALWNAAAVERDPASLLAGAPVRYSRSRLPAMSALEETMADYSAAGLTTRPHLMTHLRDKLRARGILSAADLQRAKHDSWVKTAGVVIVRQRPGTAKGFLFITLEDETGISNLIVTPDLFQRNRALLRGAGILYAEGRLQQVDGVTAIRARHFGEIRMPGAIPPSHDFH
jgi:error-prone DNA polymerase